MKFKRIEIVQMIIGYLGGLLALSVILTSPIARKDLADFFKSLLNF